MLKKQTIAILSILIGTIFLFSGCAPKSDPAMVRKVNEFFSKTSGKTYKGSGKFSPIPYAVGQYVTHGNTEDNGNRSVNRTAIVGREGSGWILETYSVNDHSESCTQMLIVGLDKIQTAHGFEHLDILWVKIKDENGQIRTIEGPPLMMAKSFYKNALQSFDISAMTNQGAGTDITVPAGTFTNTSDADSELSVLGMTFRSKTWYHSKVPVNGMVKSIVDGGKMTSVLLDFGLSGAKPCF
jgi:hypothetical protein